MMKNAKKALCLALSLSCVLGVSSIAATTAHASSLEGKEVIVNSGDESMVNLEGTLVVKMINYIKAPGPGEPVYSYFLKTDDGKMYSFNKYGYSGDELAKHNGERITIVGTVNSNSPLYIEVLNYSFN